MSAVKHLVRARFRTAVFDRDGGRCVVCDRKAAVAHHIINRDGIAGGGYVKENGASLCAPCHRRAEEHWGPAGAPTGYGPDDLFRKIGSSEAEAREAAGLAAVRDQLILRED